MKRHTRLNKHKDFELAWGKGRVPKAVILGVVGMMVGMVMMRGGGVLALTYSSDTDLLFTVNPSVSVDVSGDLSIDNLAPNAASDSNIITITAGSTAPTGYTLYTNVGDGDNNYQDLRISSSDTTNVFSVLESGVGSLSNIGDSKWGYSYCDATSGSSNCDTASNWVKGNVGSTSTGYGAMPLYNNANHNNDIKLADTTVSGSTVINFKIGVKASPAQASGIYTNVINFINVSKIVTTSYTLNYLDNSGTTATGTLPAASTGTTTNGTFNIATQKPTNTNANYVFKAWCTVDNSTNPTTCPNTGSLIYPGNIYVIASTNASWSGNVYAVWQNNAS